MEKNPAAARKEIVARSGVMRLVKSGVCYSGTGKRTGDTGEGRGGVAAKEKTSSSKVWAFWRGEAMGIGVGDNEANVR